MQPTFVFPRGQLPGKIRLTGGLGGGRVLHRLGGLGSDLSKEKIEWKGKGNGNLRGMGKGKT